MPPEGSDLIFDHRHNATDRVGTAGTARTSATPRGQSGTVNSASRGRGLTGKPVTESNLSLCVPAQVPADLDGRAGEIG
jgi:hypothetical protein